MDLLAGVENGLFFLPAAAKASRHKRQIYAGLAWLAVQRPPTPGQADRGVRSSQGMD